MSSSHLSSRAALALSSKIKLLLVHTALDWMGGQWAVICRDCEWSLYVQAGVPTFLQVKSLAMLQSRMEVQEEEENVRVTHNRS